MALYPLDTAHDACRNTCTYLDEPCRMFDGGDDETNVIAPGEWVGLNLYLDLAAVHGGGLSLAAALDRSSDRAERLSILAERRGQWELALVRNHASVVLWHLADTLDPEGLVVSS